MEEHSHNFFASKASIVGLFAVLTAALTIPIMVLVAQQPQTLRGSASEPENTPSLAPPSTATQEKIIAGYVYHDQNRDGQRNNEEKPFPDVVVTISELKKSTDENNVIKLKADNYGYFKHTFYATSSDKTDYVIKVVLPPGYKTITTNPVLFSNSQKGSKEIIEFGLYPMGVPEPTATSTPSQPTNFLNGD